MMISLISYDVENYADLGGSYPPRPNSASADKVLLDLHNSSHPTHPHTITCLTPTILDKINGKP